MCLVINHISCAMLLASCNLSTRLGFRGALSTEEIDGLVKISWFLALEIVMSVAVLFTDLLAGSISG